MIFADIKLHACIHFFVNAQTYTISFSLPIHCKPCQVFYVGGLIPIFHVKWGTLFIPIAIGIIKQHTNDINVHVHITKCIYIYYISQWCSTDLEMSLKFFSHSLFFSSTIEVSTPDPKPSLLHTLYFNCYITICRNINNCSLTYKNLWNLLLILTTIWLTKFCSFVIW